MSGRLAFIGIDVAVAKQKRLPVAACLRSATAIEPLQLNSKGAPKPPTTPGNAAIVDAIGRRELAAEAVGYLRAVENHFQVRIGRIAVDAPSAPRPDDVVLREAEAALDREGISYIQTPSVSSFTSMPQRVREHLSAGGSEATVPCANQLWMLFGFDLFTALRQAGWECLEVYPHATVCEIGAAGLHKSKAGAVLAQLMAAALHTNWPTEPKLASLKSIAYGSQDDRLDAYLAAWVASLEEHERRAIGKPPDDVIWVPRI